MMPTDENAIYQYLGPARSGRRPGHGLADRRALREQSLEVLENEPERLAEIKGISLQKAQQIGKSFRQQVGVRRLMEFICSFELRPVLAMRMYQVLRGQGPGVSAGKPLSPGCSPYRRQLL